MLRHIKTAILSVLIMTIIFGLLFPLVITLIAQTVFPHQANGNLIIKDGIVIGSEIIGQNFTQPEYFHPRPSAAGSGYDAGSSGGTNLGPTSRKLVEGMEELAVAYRTENGLSPETPLPADAVTHSASGLDPHISPANAHLQIARVAQARGLGENQVRELIDRFTEGRFLGFIGSPRVNVLKLNLALDKEFGEPSSD